jgi:hypothetical protein
MKLHLVVVLVCRSRRSGNGMKERTKKGNKEERDEEWKRAATLCKVDHVQ